MDVTRGGQEQPTGGEDQRTSVWNEYKLAVTTWKPQTPPSVSVFYSFAEALYSLSSVTFKCLFCALWSKVLFISLSLLLCLYHCADKALLYISHGVGEYMGRYDKLGKYLAEKGILVYGHDHVGHGNSQGQRTYIETFNTYVEDVVGHIGDMKAQYPDVPSMLMGHSLGGLIATLVAKQHHSLISALLLSSPALDTIPAYGSWMANVIQYAVGLVMTCFPHAQLMKIDTNDISSIPEEVKEYVNDPLIYHGGLKARFIYEFMNAVGNARSSVHSISLPLFLVHGDEDRLVPISASEFIQRNIGSESKTYEVFAQSRHEVLHDKDQDRAAQLIADWIMAHLMPDSSP